MEAIGSSETSAHKKTTRSDIPENGILDSHRRENLKYYNLKYVGNSLNTGIFDFIATLTESDPNIYRYVHRLTSKFISGVSGFEFQRCCHYPDREYA
jgi:hypothetical protein